MNIEWWMIDGILCIIIFAAAVWGAVKGIGDTIVRIAGMAGGIALGVMFSDKLSSYLMSTKMSRALYLNIYVLIRGEEPGEEGGNAALETLNSTGDPISYQEKLSKSIGSMFDNAADRAAEEAAQKLTQIAVSVIGFAPILLAVAAAGMLIRLIIKNLRKTSFVIGFTDRVLGFVLGGVRGLLIAWVVTALLVPVVTLLEPADVPALIDSIQKTTVAKVLYDVNPLLLVVKYILK